MLVDSGAINFRRPIDFGALAPKVNFRRDLQQRFVRAYFRGVGEEDLAERPPGVLARAAMQHFEFGAGPRQPGQFRVRVFNPTAGAGRLRVAAHGRDDRHGRHAVSR